MAEPSKARVCGGSLAGTEGSNPAGGSLSLVSVVRHVEVSATGRSFVQRSPIDWGVSECAGKP